MKINNQQTFDASTVLADIRKLHSVPESEWLMQATKNEFARINGWEVSVRGFGLAHIGRRNRTYSDGEYSDARQPVLDHCLYFRCNGKYAAVVSQPYSPN